MPARSPSPFNPARPALIEPIVQPLYGSVLITGATPEASLAFFNVAQGSAGQNPVFTNLETPGILANPKIFTVEGYRLHIAQNVPTTDGAATMDQFTALLEIIERYFFRFVVGVKEYLRVPAFYLNSGLGAWLQNANAANPQYTGQIGIPSHESYMKIKARKITIPPQQSFFAELNKGPTLAALTGTTNRRVWAFLEGTLGREVM